MNKRTEKEQMADEMLEAAKFWQNRRGRISFCKETDAVYYSISDVYPYGTLSIDSETDWSAFTALLASAALSEVAGMGFDVVDARTGK